MGRRAFRDAHAHKVPGPGLGSLAATIGVGKVAIAGVDNDVAFFEEFVETVEHSIHRLAR